MRTVRGMVAMGLAATMMVALIGCGADNVQPDEPQPKEATVASEVEEEEVAATEEAVEEQGQEELPAYKYPGPELFYSVLYQYIIDEFSPHFDVADVGIPSPYIVEVDEADKEDIKVYGDFWYMNYSLNGDILECEAGGSFPGCIHIKSTDEGYEVIGMDVVEDGGNFDESAREIFGEYYDVFMKVYSNSEFKEETRAQIIANYVAANNLNITAYKDYGWGPVELPEENIDSFYSYLD